MNEKLIKKIYEKNRLNFCITVFVLLTGAFLQNVIAIFLQQVLDIAVDGTKEDIYQMAIIGIAFVAVMAVFWMAERFFRNAFIEKALVSLKNEVCERILQKNISTFQRETTATYLSALSNDMNAIENNYLQSIFLIVLNVFYFVFALAIMLWYDPLLTVCVLGLMMLSVAASTLSGGKLAKEETLVSTQNERFVGQVKDLLGGFPVIKSFQAEKSALRLFTASNRELETQKCRRRKTESFLNIVGNSLGFCIQAGVMLIGAYFAMNGRITVGVLIAFVQLMNFIIIPVQQIPRALANRKAALRLLEKMEELLRVDIAQGQKVDIEKNEKGICFEKVSFGYEPEKPVLKDVSLTLEAGKSYAIVGASGSGKSTLLQLLLGGYEDYTGSIQINGQEIRQASPDSIYDLMAVVWQNVFVFDSTIEDNITMFGQFTEEQIEKAVKSAGLEDLVSEKGLSYRCGENGCQLSGGEKQRISIARCLIRQPDILLMDEATSALDTETSGMIEATIGKLHNMTRIVITHKLQKDLLKQYDRIVVMQDGQVKGFGTYDELWEQNDYFTRLLAI